jgi:small GTP-binding protein
MMDPKEDDEIKVILLGESGVGKTNLINISTGGTFNENEISSSNSTFSMKKLTVKGSSYTIKIWDTIGQEKLRHLTKLFYNDSKIVVFVYDITVKDTFEQLKSYWVKDVDEKLGKDIVKGIVGNKIDLFINEQVTEEEGEEFAKSVGAKFLTTSAKTEGPKKFEDLLTQLLEEYLTKNGGIKKDNSKIVLDKNKGVKNAGMGKKCC